MCLCYGGIHNKEMQFKETSSWNGSAIIDQEDIQVPKLYTKDWIPIFMGIFLAGFLMYCFENVAYMSLMNI